MDESFALGLVPAPDPLPAPWWLIETLEHVTFLVHILLANLVVGGLLLALFRRDGGEAGPKPGGALTPKLPTLMALTITAGVAPLLFLQVQYGHLFYTSAVLMGLWWMLFIPAVIVGYYGLYLRRRWQDASPPLSRVATVVSAFLLLGVGFLWVNGLTLMRDPPSWLRWFEDPGGTLLHLSDPSIAPRLLHFLLASVAIAGLFVAVVWRLRSRKGVEGATRGEAHGLRLFAHATAAQLAVGTWYYLVQPSPVRKLFMGGDVLMTVVFGVGFAVSLVTLVLAWRRRLVGTLVGFGATMAAMVLLRALLRSARFEAVVDPSTLPLTPQYGVLAVFLLVLVLGVWAVVAMVRWSLRTTATGEGAQG